MESHNSELQDSHALTSFLVIDYLQKEGVSQHLLDKLSTELSQKGIFKSMITMDGRSQPCTFGDLKSQFPPPSTPLIKNMVQHQYHKQKECLQIKQEKESIIQRIKEEHDLLSARKRRDILTRRSSLKSLLRSRAEYENFPAEIFTEYWGKLKTFFGHLKREIDPEDPLNGSPVYNLSYDKNGKFIVTAADDGIIKIWSTYNGELVNTLIGHNSDINATSLSDCGNYLASCSNESLIKIWHLETGCPIAAFNDHEGVVCSVNFFSMPVTNKPGEKHRRGLVSAADDGTIMVYFEDDYINNGGIYKENQKKMKLKADDTVKGFCSIDVHPDGFIAAGTSGGSIVIWNRLLDIDTRRIERHRIIKKEHSRDCHLTVWNKDGTKLISASFDGTAKAWPWNKTNFESNRHMEALFVLESELGKGQEIKCCAVSWSCKGRYAIASFSKKLNRSTEDNEVIRGNIQVYDLSINKRTHKFENTYDKGLFENYIFIIEAHPFNEAIIMSADYDGKIIIWDIEHGHMLNIFVEDCSHLGFPLCQAPILDGKFSPDGLSFCVTNYHGSFSLYGYGDRDLFITTPTEQFFMKEFGEYDLEPTTSQVISLEHGGLESHFVEKGPLCSSKKKIYTEDFTEHGYYTSFDEARTYKRFTKALLRKKTESRPSQEGLNTENCLKALKEKLSETIRRKTEKALEDYYQELTEKKSEGSLGPTTDTSYQSGKLSQGQIKRLLRSNNEGFSLKFDEEKTELQSQEEKPKVRLAPISNRLTEFRMYEMDNTLETRDDEPPRRPKSEQDFQEEEEEQSIQPTRRRRVRRMLLEDTQEISGDNTQIPSPKSVKEERSEEKTVQQQRKHRRLILDDEEAEAAQETSQIQETKPVEEKKESTRPRVRMEEHFDSLEERPEENSTSLVRTQSRELSGRRDRNLASNSSNVRQAVATNQNLRASRARTMQLLQQQQAIEEDMCARCGFENARIQCSSECGRNYHSACSKRHGRENERGVFTCFSCLYKSRKKEKPNGAKVLRTWASKDVTDRATYLPQVGDFVTYVFQAHEEFILHYFDFLRFSKGEIFPYEKYKNLLQDNICKIINISYQFPLSPRWYKGQLNILMKITLEIVENEALTGNTFKVTFFQADFCEFIMQNKLYLLCLHNASQLRHEQEISYYYRGEIKQGVLAEVSPREEGPFPNSHWKSLRVVEREDGVHSVRKSRKDDAGIYLSPWEVFWGDLSSILKVDEDMTKDFANWAIREFVKLYENNTEQYEIFLEEVDKDTYKDYPQIVVFEMNIQKIKRRLANFFYRHKEAIIADIRLMMLNCHEYNEPTSIIAIWSKELADKMIRIVNPHAINPPVREHAKRQKTNRRRPRFYEEITRDQGAISRENIIPDLSNEERPMPRTRARKLVLQDEDEAAQEVQEKPKKFTYPSLEAQNQQQNAADLNRGRLKRGTRNERKEEAPASHENEGLLRSKVKRKENEFMRMQMDESEENGEEEEEEDLEEREVQPQPMHMNLRHQKPQENPANNTANYRGRLRQKESKKFTQFFGEDSGNEEDIQPEAKMPVVNERIMRVERREEPVYHHHTAPAHVAPAATNAQKHQQIQHQYQPQYQPQSQPQYRPHPQPQPQYQPQPQAQYRPHPHPQPHPQPQYQPQHQYQPQYQPQPQPQLHPQPQPQPQPQYQSHQPQSHFADLNSHDDFLQGFLYNGIDPSHPEFLDQELPFQDSAAIKGERSQEKPFEYKMDYNNAPEMSPNSDKKPFDDGYFMDNIQIFADRDENNAEESMPIQTTSVIPTINNDNDNQWGTLNGKRPTYERRYSSDQELSNSGFGSLFESDSMSTGSKRQGNFQNPLVEEEPQIRYQAKIFKGSDDEESDFEQGAKRQAKNKRLKI